MIASVNELLPGAEMDRNFSAIQQSVYMPPTAADRLRKEAARVGMSTSEFIRFSVAYLFANLDEARRIMEPAPESMAAIHPRTVNDAIT